MSSEFESSVREVINMTLDARLREAGMNTLSGGFRKPEVFNDRRAEKLVPAEWFGKADKVQFSEFGDLIKNWSSAL